MVHLFPCLEMSALYCIIILCLAMIFSVAFLLPDRLLIPFKPNTILITMIIVRYFTVILLTYQSIFYFIVHIMIISILYNLVFKLSCMRSNIWLDHMYRIILRLYLLMLLHPLYYYDFLLLHFVTFFSWNLYRI